MKFKTADCLSNVVLCSVQAIAEIKDSNTGVKNLFLQIFKYCLHSGYVRSCGPQLSSQLGKKVAFLYVRHCCFEVERERLKT